MNQIIVFLNKAFIFLCLIGVLLASSNFTDLNNELNPDSQNTEITKKIDAKKDFKLKPISFEATINYLQTQLQQFFYINFYKANFFDFKVKSYKLILQNISDQLKVLLFTKIIPSQAP